MPKDAASFAELLGLDHHEMAEGEAEVALEVTPGHLNLGGVVHGGVLASLLDLALGSAVVSTLADGEWCATQSLTTDFLEPVEAGRLVATARVDRRGRSTAYPRGEVRTGDGRLIARATGVWAVRGGD